MKICIVTPGVYDISRASNYGAIERIMFNIKLELEKLGHQVDIKYPNEVNAGVYDICHVHMANQAMMLKLRNIQYVFTMHDHHAMLHDNVRRENEMALSFAELGIVPAEHLLKLFGNLPNVVYLPHGVDTSLFTFKKKLDVKQHKLLCIANNGIIGDNSYDRKGFREAIDAATLLGLPITIAGPTKNNKEFFDSNPELLEYRNLNIIYDLDEIKLIELYHSHTLFLHPSRLEAGHPNLTLLEAISTGLPVIGTYESSLELKSLYKVRVGYPLDIACGINHIINNNNYTKYVGNTQTDIYNFTWSKIIKQLENLYLNVIEERKNMKDEFVSIYDNAIKNENSIKDNVEITYNDGVMCHIKGISDRTYDVQFIDMDENRLIYSNTCKPGTWNAPSRKWFVNWKVIVNGEEHILNLIGKNVLIVNESPAMGDIIAWFPYLEVFRLKHNCTITYCGPHLQLFEKNYPEIKFIEYTNDINVIRQYDATYRLGIFDSNENERFERHKRHWKRLTLQEIACDMLGLDYEPIKANLVVNNTGRPILNKYVVITEWSTLMAKLWMYPKGWQTIVDYLNLRGFKVIIVSKERTNLKNVIDRTDKTIEDTINTIYHSEFCLAPSTAVNWIAWSLDKKCIVPSGFSESWAEYDNPFRIINKQHCHGCFNDVNLNFDKNWEACPMKKEYICSTSITPEQVIEMIEKII